MGGLSWWHWVVIAGAFILLFGAKRLPDAARGLGRSLRILKSEVAAMTEEDPAAVSPVATDQSRSLGAGQPAAAPSRTEVP